MHWNAPGVGVHPRRESATPDPRTMSATLLRMRTDGVEVVRGLSRWRSAGECRPLGRRHRRGSLACRRRRFASALFLLLECRRVLRPGRCASHIVRTAVRSRPAGRARRARVSRSRRRRVLRQARAPRSSGRPLVSVLIPAYNPRYFAEALASAIAQTYDPLEIVVCDDSEGSDIEAIVRQSIGKRDLRYLRNPVRLRGRDNCIRCLASARGDFVKFVNDDDLLEPSCVERLMAVFRDVADVTLATSRRRRIDERGGDAARSAGDAPDRRRRRRHFRMDGGERDADGRPEFPRRTQHGAVPQIGPRERRGGSVPLRRRARIRASSTCRRGQRCRCKGNVGLPRRTAELVSHSRGAAAVGAGDPPAIHRQHPRTAGGLARAGPAHAHCARWLAGQADAAPARCDVESDPAPHLHERRRRSSSGPRRSRSRPGNAVKRRSG